MGGVAEPPTCAAAACRSANRNSDLTTAIWDGSTNRSQNAMCTPYSPFSRAARDRSWNSPAPPAPTRRCLGPAGGRRRLRTREQSGAHPPPRPKIGAARTRRADSRPTRRMRAQLRG
eukprot:scaffold14091_cov121-Isochrysis_galbana.AAC.1